MYQFIIFIFIRCIIPKNTEEGGKDTYKLSASLQNASAKVSHHIAPVSIIHLLQRCVLGSPGSRETWGEKKTYNRACNYEKRRIFPPNKADSYSSLLSQNELQGKDLEKKAFLCDHPHITKRLTIFREKKLSYA